MQKFFTELLITIAINLILKFAMPHLNFSSPVLIEIMLFVLCNVVIALGFVIWYLVIDKKKRDKEHNETQQALVAAFEKSLDFVYKATGDVKR